MYKRNLFPRTHWSVMLFGCLLLLINFPVYGQTEKWVGTWSCAPYAAGNNTPPAPYLANNTLRQIVRVSIGGNTVRVKFSNITGKSPVTINAVNIALSPDASKSAIDASTTTALTFNGNTSVTMEAGTSAMSDAVTFPLAPSTCVAITIYYGQCESNASLTHHYGSRTDSYLLAGDQTANAAFTGAIPIERWYTINTIDVLTTKKSAAVAVIGNSITDGYGLHGGLQNRWPDFLSKRLLANKKTSHIGVLNMGIGGTNVATSGLGRFKQDILGQSGVRWVVVFYGVNDIGANASAETIINAYKKMIKDAHAQKLKVYGGTITPFGGHSYFTEAHEAVRGEVNHWIRTKGNFDGYIDFDKALRDPADTTKLLPAFSNDWLHPNAAGYQKLGETVDLRLFKHGK